VSFYFDGRLAAGPYNNQVSIEILDIAKKDGDAVVGLLSADGITISVEFISSREELEQFVQEMAPAATVYYGPFPARNNDGKNAITVDLPDSDGILRSHPH